MFKTQVKPINEGCINSKIQGKKIKNPKVKNFYISCVQANYRLNSHFQHHDVMGAHLSEP